MPAEIELNAEQEAALDRAWEKLDAEGGKKRRLAALLLDNPNVEDDWWQALLAVAFDRTGDMERAIKLADAGYAETPQRPEGDEPDALVGADRPTGESGEKAMSAYNALNGGALVGSKPKKKASGFYANRKALVPPRVKSWEDNIREIEESARRASTELATQGPFRYKIEAESNRGRKIEFEVIASTKYEASEIAHKEITKYGMRPSAIQKVIFIGPVNAKGLFGRKEFVRSRGNDGVTRCFNDGVPVPCEAAGQDGQQMGGGDEQGGPQQPGQDEQGQGQGGAEQQQSPFAAPPPGETLVPPTECCVHNVDPYAVDPNTGVTIAARCGVPGMESPPPPKQIPRLDNLTGPERDAESRFAEAYLEDPDKMVAEYARAKAGNPPLGDGVNFFNLDDVKDLSPDYNPQGVSKEENLAARGTYNLAVHATANAIAKRAFVDHLEKEFGSLPPERRFVLVTSGGVAAGKGYALGKGEKTGPLSKLAGAVWDAAGEQNSTENPWILEECRKRGIPVKYAFIHGDPSKNWENPGKGVVDRANVKGRMVTARLYAESYAIGGKNFKAFMDDHIDDDDVEFFVFNNDLGPDPKQVPGMMQESLTVDADKVYARAAAVLEERRGKDKPAVTRGGLIDQRVWGATQQLSAKALRFRYRTKAMEGGRKMPQNPEVKSSPIADVILEGLAWYDANYEEADRLEMEKRFKIKPSSAVKLAAYKDEGERMADDEEELIDDMGPPQVPPSPLE